MARGNRLFVGEKVRQLRTLGRMDQAAMARLLGISVPYLSQLENNDRPLTARVKSALASAFPLDWSDFDERPEEQLLGAFNWALANPGHGSAPPDPERTERLYIQYPDFAARYVELHHALRQTEQRLAMAEEALETEGPTQRTAWSEVSDWFQVRDNYLHELDSAAEDLAIPIGKKRSSDESWSRMIDLLASHHCEVRLEALEPTALRVPSADGRMIRINSALSEPSQRFQVASHLASLQFATEIEALIAATPELSSTAERLLRHALISYAAAAALMPYAVFRDLTRDKRHNINLLCEEFKASAEQVCHRLSTLQRPGQRGVPFFFCRIDKAGNILKRHSATRHEFGRFGHICPLWHGHEAAANPGAIITQLAEMPDGTRYISLACGIERASPHASRKTRNYAVALVCESLHASHLAYADDLPLSDEAAFTPIGPNCRLCPRDGCTHRAYPPIDRPIHVERGERHIIPYSIS
jgi:predicted transcriptional regulator/transcriptional regulator with XRE-family HTH domain